MSGNKRVAVCNSTLNTVQPIGHEVPFPLHSAEDKPFNMQPNLTIRLADNFAHNH
jgi:hypothetical protein